MRFQLFVASLWILAAEAGAAQTTTPGDTARFSCRIRPEKMVYKRGEEIAFTVELLNKSTKPEVVLKHVLGFDFPTTRFEVLRRGSLGSDKKMKRYRSCFVLPVAVRDFVVVAPGQVFNPFATPFNKGTTITLSEAGYGNLPPGDYTVTFTYACVSNYEKKGHRSGTGELAIDQAQLLTLIAQVPALELYSNIAHLNITR
ncbi:MAG TPA: hypothetical protein VF629_14020 [Hymenobacter sp.]|jgi:hypothetical protein|uniref:hypothetical protein n=1 Tax=Hymenobacter sp. TaxID=1898978 RepID=UPI002ED7ADDB